MVEDGWITDKFAIYLGDSVEISKEIPNNSIGISIYSPPFAYKDGALYQYSSSERDLSNCRNYEEFFIHYDFFLEQQYRITMPGRMNMVHCIDTPSGNSGNDYLIDFPGDLIEAHIRCRNPRCKSSEFDRRRGFCGHGWFDYVNRYDIWKEPLGVRNRLMVKDLAHKTVVDDSSRCNNAGFDYLLGFRKKGKNTVPIEHPVGLIEYHGERQIPHELLHYKGYQGRQTENRYSHWIWRQYASSNWDDIRIDNVLKFKDGRDDKDERHIHPLQLDVVRRALTLWSNPGETLWTPCMGVGTEVYCAVIEGRKGIGGELKPSYFRQAVKNLKSLETPEVKQSTIFGLIAEKKNQQSAVE